MTQKLEAHNLSVIPAGTRHGAVHTILRSPRFDQMLADARKNYDYIVLDTRRCCRCSTRRCWPIRWTAC